LKDETPIVSVIVLSFNSSKLGRIFEDCIASLVATDYPNFEVILVDNGSSDNSAEEIAKKFQKIKLVKLPRNLGFTGGNNAGAKAISNSSELIAFLNSDVLLQPDWLLPMAKMLISNPRLGVVGAEGVVKSFGAKTFYLPKVKRPFFAPVAQGYCMLVKKSVFNLLGGFNTSLFMYEDEVDFCERVQAAGYRIAIISSDSIRHLGSGSISRNAMTALQTYLIARNTFYALFETADSSRLPLALMILSLHTTKRCLYFRNWLNTRAEIRGMVDGFFGLKNGVHPTRGRIATKLDLPPISLDFLSLLPIMRQRARTTSDRILLRRLEFVPNS
jgi:GT2 family glycosyltransferase